MLLEIAKFNVVKRIFTCLPKERAISHRNIISLSARHFISNKYNVEHSKICFRGTLHNQQFIIKYYNSTEAPQGELSKVTFESVCAETLESLTEYFEELVESAPEFKNADVTYSDGVLTVNLGNNYGTYVINRQSPNLQIWLSSPKSGPKRYDFLNGTWVYKHDKTTLHSLLEKEIQEITDQKVQFLNNCLYAKASI